MPWNDNELENIARTYLQGTTPRCPICKGRIECNEIALMGRKTPIIMMNCSKCGERGQYSNSYIEALDLEWTKEEMRTIVDEYQENGYANCPRDQATLQINEIRLLSRRVPIFMINCKLCGRKFQSADMEQEEEKVAPFSQKYQVLRPIAQGGMGQVSLVLEKQSNREYAAKTIRPEFLRTSEDVVRRFHREKRILSSLDHPNIVPIRDSYMEEQGGIFVMDYMPNGDLRQQINNPSIDHQKLVEMFDGVVNGLEYLHSHVPAIVHRDLKPANILIDENWRARISDFGLAMLSVRDSTILTGTGHFIGTPKYAAPEQHTEGNKVDERADIYSLSLIAYEIATRKCTSGALIIRSLGHHDFDAAMALAIAERPEDRKISAQEIAVALRDYVRDKK